MEFGVSRAIAEYANGDARVALNTLDLTLQAKIMDKKSENCIRITVEEIKEGQ